MPRVRPPGQIDKLLDAAEAVFVARGPERSQISMIAREAGVAPGTLYHYFVGKEALFGWVLARAQDPSVELPVEIPISAPPATPSEMLAPLRDIASMLPVLSRAASGRASATIKAELRAVVTEFYERLEAGRRLASVVEAAAADLPEVRERWVEIIVNLVDLWEAYLTRRIKDGLLRDLAEPRVAARFVIETCTYFARTRVRDRPKGLPVDDEVVRALTIEMLVYGLLRQR